MPDTGDRAATDPTPLFRDLTAAQADGMACVTCNADYTRSPVPHIPVGVSTTGSQVFACEPCVLDAARRDAIEAIRDALDIPFAAIDAVSQTLRYDLAERRREAAYTCARTIAMFSDTPTVIRKEIEHLRLRIRQTPVVYETLTGPGAGAAVVSVP